MLGKLSEVFCRLQIIFNITSFKISFSGITLVSNRLDPDQARHSVEPDLDPNCLQRSLADDKIRC